MYRLTIKDILEATGGVLLCGDENTEIKDVCINSKEIKPGDLFVPIIVLSRAHFTQVRQL